MTDLTGSKVHVVVEPNTSGVRKDRNQLGQMASDGPMNPHSPLLGRNREISTEFASAENNTFNK